MAATAEQQKAIGNALQAFVTSASNMTTESINQIAQLLSSPAIILPVDTNTQLDVYDGYPGGMNRRRSRAILARKKADKKRKDRVNLRPLNAFICFRCESS